MTPQLLPLARKHVAMCERIPKHQRDMALLMTSVEKNWNRKSYAGLTLYIMVSYQKELPWLFGKNNEVYF